jgi:two-component system, chemotaxis family, chemotaxis protein CheY
MGAPVACGSSEPEVRMEILIVDDEEDILQALHEIFADEGYAVAVAANGLEALEILRTCDDPPRLILLDLMMPQMDGWEFLARIDEDARLHAIPVALMSAHASIRRAFDKHRQEERPKRLLFPKPLNLLRLLATARHFCRDAPNGLAHAFDDVDDGQWSLREAPTARFSPLRIARLP